MKAAEAVADQLSAATDAGGCEAVCHLNEHASILAVYSAESCNAVMLAHIGTFGSLTAANSQVHCTAAEGRLCAHWAIGTANCVTH